MKTLAAGVIIDAARAHIARVREKTLTTKFFRDNANARRALPEQQPSTDDAELGLLYALQMGEAVGHATTGGESVASTGTSGVGVNPAKTELAGPAAGEGSQGGSGGPVSQTTINAGGARIDAGRSGVAPAAGGNGDSRRPRNWAVPWIVATATSVLGAGGLGYGISNSINRVTVPPDQHTTVIEGDTMNAQYPVVDWIQENGWHRK